MTTGKNHLMLHLNPLWLDYFPDKVEFSSMQGSTHLLPSLDWRGVPCHYFLLSITVLVPRENPYQPFPWGKKIWHGMIPSLGLSWPDLRIIGGTKGRLWLVVEGRIVRWAPKWDISGFFMMGNCFQHEIYWWIYIYSRFSSAAWDSFECWLQCGILGLVSSSP